MKEKLKLLISRQDFVNDLAKKLKVKNETIEWYFRTKIPTIHLQKIEELLDFQLELDKKTREMNVIAWEDV